MTSPRNRAHPQRIEAVEDIVVVLDSAAPSHSDLMQCVAVARSSGDLRLARLAAEQAFDQLVAGDRPEPDAVREVAHLVVRIYVAQADSAGGLRRQLRRAKAWLDRHRSVLDVTVGPEHANDEMRLLSEVQALLATSDPEGLVRLGSRLEDLDRPDLSTEVVGSIA